MIIDTDRTLIALPQSERDIRFLVESYNSLVTRIQVRTTNIDRVVSASTSDSDLHVCGLTKDGCEVEETIPLKWFFLSKEELRIAKEQKIHQERLERLRKLV